MVGLMVTAVGFPVCVRGTLFSSFCLNLQTFNLINLKREVSVEEKSEKGQFPQIAVMAVEIGVVDCWLTAGV